MEVSAIRGCGLFHGGRQRAGLLDHHDIILAVLTQVKLCKVEAFDAWCLKLQRTRVSAVSLCTQLTGYHFLSTSDLLPLLDGVYGVRLELELLRAAQLPVQDDDDEDGEQHWHDHADDQPDAAALSLCRWDGEGLNSWTQVRDR